MIRNYGVIVGAFDVVGLTLATVKGYLYARHPTSTSTIRISFDSVFLSV
jgi:hypothetical protein